MCKVEIAGITNPGLIRDNNEDFYSIRPEDGLLIVADGMGGHAAGETASKLAVQTVLENLNQYSDLSEAKVKAAIIAANQAILAEAEGNPDLKGMGTTFTLVAVMKDNLLLGHIGDSMAFLIDRDTILPITSDHSVSGQLLALGKITQAEAASHPQRHVLTRALGIHDCPQVEIRLQPWKVGQNLLLCTDGLTDMLDYQEIQQIVIGLGSLEDKLNQLLSLALERGAPDNVTIILAKHDREGVAR